MKRALALLMVLLLIAVPVLAEETVDIANLTDEQLMQLYADISNELIKRKCIGNENRIGRGEFIVGQQIKPGTYEFLCTETDTNDLGYNFNYIKLWNLKEDGLTKNEMISGTYDITAGSIATLILEDGMLVVISGCSGELVPVEANWIP